MTLEITRYGTGGGYRQVEKIRSYGKEILDKISSIRSMKRATSNESIERSRLEGIGEPVLRALYHLVEGLWHQCKTCHIGNFDSSPNQLMNLRFSNKIFVLFQQVALKYVFLLLNTISAKGICKTWRVGQISGASKMGLTV